MKIAFIYDVIYPFSVGGAEKRIWEIARRLVTMGHSVTIYCMKCWEGDKDIIDRDGVRLWGVCPKQELFTNGRRSIPKALYFSWKVLIPLFKERYDIIDCQEFPYFPAFVAKLYSILKNIPLVISWFEVWDNYWFEYLGIKGIFGRAIERIVSRLPRKILAISHFVENDLVHIGVKNEKIEIVPDGVDCERIYRVSEDKLNVYDLVYSGRLVSHKNVDVLIKSISLLKGKNRDVTCAISGDGPERTNLESLKESLGLENNIKFLGFLEKDEEVFLLMKQSKVFILPSTREGAGLVTLEANSCGLPVITIDHPRNGAQEMVVDGENGFLSQLTEDDLAAKIELALNKAEEMKTSCISFAKKYDWDRIAELVESAYKKII